MERLALTARLRPDKRDDAERLIREGPPFDPHDLGFDRHSVYLSAEEVVFVFEGGDVERLVSALANDPARAAAFAAWGPIVADTPRLAHEVYSWERTGAQS